MNLFSTEASLRKFVFAESKAEVLAHQGKASRKARLLKGGDATALARSCHALIGPRQNLPVQLCICDVPALGRYTLRAEMRPGSAKRCVQAIL